MNRNKNHIPRHFNSFEIDPVTKLPAKWTYKCGVDWKFGQRSPHFGCGKCKNWSDENYEEIFERDGKLNVTLAFMAPMMWSASIYSYHNDVQKRPPMTWFENGFFVRRGIGTNVQEIYNNVYWKFKKKKETEMATIDLPPKNLECSKTT